MTFAYQTRSLSFAAALLLPLLLPFLSPGAAYATDPKLDTDTCNQMRLEHNKFVASGAEADLERGAEWGKANLSADKMREMELFIQLDEQIKFGCRDAKLTVDAERAAEAARRLEANPDLDPTEPLPAEGQAKGADAKSPEPKSSDSKAPDTKDTNSKDTNKKESDSKSNASSASEAHPAKPKAEDGDAAPKVKLRPKSARRAHPDDTKEPAPEVSGPPINQSQTQ